MPLDSIIKNQARRNILLDAAEILLPHGYVTQSDIGFTAFTLWRSLNYHPTIVVTDLLVLALQFLESKVRVTYFPLASVRDELADTEKRLENVFRGPIEQAIDLQRLKHLRRVVSEVEALLGAL